MPKTDSPNATPIVRGKTLSGTVRAGTPFTVIALTLACAAFLFPVAVAGSQDTIASEAAPVTVVNFKWGKDRRAAEMADDRSATMTPQPAMIPANKNFERQRRINDPPGVRDPNADTLDGRSAELDRITTEARETKPEVDGFTYQARIQNRAAKTLTAVFWEYQFKEKNNPAMLSRRQFVCFAKVKPQNTKDLEIFTLTAPTGVVSVKALEKKSERPFDEAVVINRVEYEDGSNWQRPDWSYDEVKLTARPATDAKKLQMCRGL